MGNGLDLDGKANVYLGGVTSTGDFPAQRTMRKSTEADAFLCRIRPAEHANTCRVFGGRQEEKLTGIALDTKRGVYAVGGTRSADFPTKDPVRAALAGQSNLFLTRLALPSLEISLSTSFGGNGDDSGCGIALDNSGNPIIAGITDSTDLPDPSDAYQRTNSKGMPFSPLFEVGIIGRFERPTLEVRTTMKADMTTPTTVACQA